LGFQQQNVPTRERVWVPDVENEREMAGVARRVLGRGAWRWGRRGLRRRWPARWGGAKGRVIRNRARTKNRFLSDDEANSGRVGVVVGSAHPLSERQLDRLKNFLPAKGVFVFERPFGGTPGQVLRRLVRSARKMEKVHGIRRWVVTGGETAFALARDLEMSFVGGWWGPLSRGFRFVVRWGGRRGGW
jgi:uncharacterized protein YgbK (DUF1537 family)